MKRATIITVIIQLHNVEHKMTVSLYNGDSREVVNFNK